MKSATPPPEFMVGTTELRDNRGFTNRQIADTRQAVVVQRYSRQDVAMVPLWEWRWQIGVEQSMHRFRPR